MIVNYKEEGWEVVTQRAHGIVAAQIAFNWKFEQLPQHWIEVMMAIAEHDDAENELDGEELLTDSGGPLNYDMKKFELDHCMKLASLTMVKSRTIALLTSLHMEFLYASAKPESGEARKFLADQKKQRAGWQKELKLSDAEALNLYNLLEWCDAFSLLICKNEMQDEQRSTEISTGPDKVTYQLKKVDDHTLTVQPWPFTETSFTVSFESRHLPQLVFTSSAQFRKKFLMAPVTNNTWTISRTPTRGSGAKARHKISGR